MRKVVFVKAVIRLEEIKIEEEKMKEVLDWPTPKRFKDIQKFLELANYYQQFIEDFATITSVRYAKFRL